LPNEIVNAFLSLLTLGDILMPLPEDFVEVLTVFPLACGRSFASVVAADIKKKKNINVRVQNTLKNSCIKIL